MRLRVPTLSQMNESFILVVLSLRLLFVNTIICTFIFLLNWVGNKNSTNCSNAQEAHIVPYYQSLRLGGSINKLSKVEGFKVSTKVKLHSYTLTMNDWKKILNSIYKKKLVKNVTKDVKQTCIQKTKKITRTDINGKMSHVCGRT